MPSKRAASVLWRIAWGLMAVLAVGVAAFLSRYLSLNPEVYFSEQKQIYTDNVFWITAHVAGGVMALLLGPFQFLERIQTSKYKFHRWFGRAYLVGVLVGSIAGFRMALIAYGGFSARLGFGTLAVLWFATGILAYVSIRKRKIQTHRKWMIRNFALTFAAVTLRIFLIIFVILLKGDFEPAYIAIAWWSWVPNIVVAQIIIDRLWRIED